mmetsp:Transcript_38109/g.89287  ORF Transcript_38109/g.89287 Transcript_38109/m.89287 type:complete len:281 (+) Transcript_38109:185-1027(+)|eukprot:CAMPEP_0178413714 /NCGR_PEP_ID=MMETSP0689_2-20121128/22669_1 /TAXON_ID=160604 /ORGANISM="Amphidinium massartii, Strain CS-259" /LENGTH=280 /DNA_ID=CAMNT_0020034993 /DNA_START=87 /DNA_END=932 /DNA_ORIENTATION=+
MAGKQVREIPFFRITVLGHEKSGKTCLVNSFVNNFCPVVYVRTDVPQLYYRTLRREMEALSNDDDEDFVTVLLEIEDCPPSRGTAASESVDEFLHNTMQMEDVQNVHAKPFSDREAPHYDPEQYMPMTHRRMGYMVVFDSCDDNSFREAQEVLRHVNDSVNSMKEDGRPVVYLVANKVDKDPIGQDFRRILDDAGYFAQKWARDHPRINFKLYECSALEFKNVRKVFLEMVDDICDDASLWQDAAALHKETDRKEHSGQEGFIGGAIGNLGNLFGFAQRR